MRAEPNRRIEAAAGGNWSDQRLAQEAVGLAEEILRAAKKEQKIGERYQAWKLNRMLADPVGKAFTLAMADQVFRPRNASRAASQFRHLVKSYGAPEYLPLHERIGLLLAAKASWVAPDLVMGEVTRKLRGETSEVVLPAEAEPLQEHIEKRRRMGARLNLNLLGEAILGEEEAERRLAGNIRQLQSADCDYISVKLTSIFSQVNVLAYDETLARVKEPLRRLYRAAMENPVEGTPKFVNLDMEEYRDLHLTCDAFRQVLDEDEFSDLEAGIVLQAYLPDSHALQKELTAWAVARRARGGAGIKLRLVKGANLAMERVEAALHGWVQAPYGSKAEVDANFKRMLHFGCVPDHAAGVRLGVGSHNIFDVAYALLLRAREGVEGRVEIEMLEGMANHQARVVEKVAGSLLFYAPVVRERDFHSAIAYLVRRLDENTAPENFLHDLFGMRPGGPKWSEQCARFLQACAEKDHISAVPARQQDRSSERAAMPGAAFENESDTDWTRRENREWIAAKRKGARKADPIRIQVGGRELFSGEFGTGVDPGNPGVELYRYSLAGEAEVEEALQVALESAGRWTTRCEFTTRELLLRVATALAAARGDLLATMSIDAGKAVSEADSELSEAIDFANYYALSLLQRGLFDGTDFKPLGAVVVAPPWNFPLAIACGGILAALAAGNAVILKPPPETVLTASELVKVLWGAGVPREALQFVPVPENEVGRKLLTDERVAAVILTGGFQTARLFQGWRPEMRLFAETSGKNAMLITAASDPDQAIKDLVKSAFGHSGQKCSAASLAILEAELYDDENFLRQLRDAAASLPVGPARDLASVVTPVIREPGEELRRGLCELEEGEEWLLQPKCAKDNPCQWSPGIRIGVSPESWYRRTECFGPVLGVIRAESFEDGLRIQNDSDFGLTGGLQSLDEREIGAWRERVEVGNAYINRPITGAVVQRQPFGGWKKSSVGPGAKAGGPNYVLQLGKWTEIGLPREQEEEVKSELLEQFVNILPDAEERLRAAAGSYAKWWNEEFSREHDPSQVLGESNVFRYRPHRGVLLRCDGLALTDVALVLLGGATCGVQMEGSAGDDEEQLAALLQVAGVDLILESEVDLCRRVGAQAGRFDSLRAPGASFLLRSAAIGADLQLIDWPVLANGRVELLHFLREQSVTETMHRYGNVIARP